MSQCVICEIALSQDKTDPHCDSKEHVFPKSIGGRKTVRGFICQQCNSLAGETWDAVLAAQMQPLSLIFGVSRERGKTPSLKTTTTSGERITLHEQGELTYTNPEFEACERSDGSVEYRIKARSLDEARQILLGLKKKHPNLDVESILSQTAALEKYPDGDFHFPIQFGGPDGGRSMVKTCLAFAYANGVDWRDCKNATSYLRDQNAKACFGYFTSPDLVSGRKAGVPLHCVALHADPQSGLVLAYAEYFGVNRIVACLGENYTGPSIKDVYSIDPRSGDIITVDVSLNFDKETIESIYDYKYCDGDAVEAALSAVLGPALRTQVDAERKRVTNNAVDKAFDECGAKPGEHLTEEHLRKIIQSIAENVAPFVMHQLRTVKRSGEK